MMKISESALQSVLDFLSRNDHNPVSVGDTITGRIVSVEKGVLLLQLGDGSRITAQIQSDGQYFVGEWLKLEVTELEQGQAYVREVERMHVRNSSSESRDNFARILHSLNLPTDSRRLEIVKALVQMGRNPEFDLIENSFKLLEGKQISDPRQAVFLAINQMDTKQEYFPLIKDFSEGTFQFLEKWNSLAEQIKHSDQKTLLPFVQHMNLYEKVAALDSSAVQKQLSAMLPAKAKHLHPEETVRNLLFHLLTIPEESLTKEIVTKQMGMFFPEYAQLEHSQQDEFSRIVLKHVQDNRSQSQLHTPTAEQVKSSVDRLMSLKSFPEHVKAADASLPKVDEWINEVDKKLKIIQAGLMRTSESVDDKIHLQVRELQSAVRFFQDVASYEAFVQIPLVLKENTTQGELYVMRRKGKRKIDAEDFSLFLSLTTKNLGVLDTFIHVRNKNVMLRIMVEGEQHYDILKKEYKPLYEALKKKGFHLYELKHTLREEKINLLNAEKEAEAIIAFRNRKIDYKV